MTAAPDRFTVDLDRLEQVVDRMAAGASELESLLADLGARVRVLHASWDGAAAAAQLDAQHRWEAGFREMHAGLLRMRAAGGRAHQGYAAAVAANVAMWDQLV
ncbi:WXG100 family type VII secretion target [Nocardioides panaciterrulae]|uniref:ESAT-6-like protein n=1 Tax=Nocardioides panaciterrulae TaxID=661492 RepID=A0A7Y9E8G4_9ACTN|nr:WXG100 family type VII secretion target [Nocardioides panaciterrulae]